MGVFFLSLGGRVWFGYGFDVVVIFRLKVISIILQAWQRGVDLVALLEAD